MYRYTSVTSYRYFRRILTLQKMCKKLTVCPQKQEPAPGKKFSEPEPPQNRPAPKPWYF